MATSTEKTGPKGAPQETEQGDAKTAPPRAAGSTETEQLIFTLRAGTGEVLKIEKIDAAGKRSDVPKDKTAELAGKETMHEIEAALDVALEAGISSMLDPGNDDDEPEERESAEEMELRKLLLGLIISRAVRRRLRRRIVQRLILAQAAGR
jgi:hypothetical protein